MRYMLDTNICIYAIKKKSESIFQNLKRHVPSDLCISAVTYAELLHGVEKSQNTEKNRLALVLLLANFEILEFDMNAAEAYGKVRAVLEKKGTPIGPLDMMIAGHALAGDMILVTNNVKEFERVDGLQIENWAKNG